MATIITISNRKGGVAKTTTAVTLAHGLALKGKAVLLVDIDPQGHVAPSLGLDREQGMYDLLMEHRSLAGVVRKARDNLWIVPGNQRTATAENALVFEKRRVDALQKPLSNGLTGNLDYLLFDTPPGRVGTLQEFALFLSDLVLIPASVDFLSQPGIVDVVQEMARLKAEKGWPGALL
ncbi:MAG: AAA family ATPase, partial [Anaerolineae bacterium]|nr:AAA family ATPase [Anaerolineae bacterium]